MSFPFLAYFPKMKVGLFKLELANKDQFVKNESIYHIQSCGTVDLNAWSVADVSLHVFFFKILIIFSVFCTLLLA
jgi:hypothetical protein